ncbi:hypothetical protein MKW94_018926 [Papaver nudicaule]|uniref:Secreted peptide n=1 Tax=Papaver nudicaule TaxID=74823 RepID=A0AA41S5W5_PAPNU|nr:hypothetical protein [Papaver nudicaule]
MCHVTYLIRILSFFVCLALASMGVHNAQFMHIFLVSYCVSLTRTTIDQGIAYVLMLVALVLTYIIHETN